MAHSVLFVVCLLIAAYQFARVPRMWAFVLLFVALMPKIALASVRGNTTPVRVDDVVIGVVLAVWIARSVTVRRKPVATTVRLKPDTTYDFAPPSPATLFLLIYWYAVAVCTLLGIAALTTSPLTGVLHVGRFIEYGLL